MQHPAQLTYKPSSFYFRQALRTATSKAEAVEVGLTVVAELESLKAWVREQGYIPPKTYLLSVEADEKGWHVQSF